MKQQQLLRRLGRMLAGDDNPLRRPVDKLESAIVAGLVVAFLIAAPLLAVFAAGVTRAAGNREMRAETNWTPGNGRPAAKRRGRRDRPGRRSGYLLGDCEVDHARWRAENRPGGSCAQRASAGQRLSVWATPAGQLTRPPLTKAELAERTIMAAAAVPTGLAVLLAIAFGVTRVVGNRRRMGCWAREWSATGPRWSSLR